MTEPVPGSIVDNIFISVQQVIVGDSTAVSISKGDFLYYNDTDSMYQPAGAAQASVINDVVQSRVDVEVAAGETASIEVLSAPSYIYTTASGVINPGALVELTTVNTVNEAVVGDIATGVTIGRMSRLAKDQAGNHAAAANDVIIVKLGV